MGDSVHGAVGFGFGGELVVGGDEVFGKAGFPREGAIGLFGFVDGEGPVHGGEVEPVIGPGEELLRVGVDELGEEDPIERGVLADEDRFLAADAPAGEDVDDRLGGMAGGAPFGNFFPSKAVDAEALLIALLPRLDRLGNEGLKFFFDRAVG